MFADILYSEIYLEFDIRVLLNIDAYTVSIKLLLKLLFLFASEYI